MRWPRRGILIRLFIYVPLIAILVWRAQGGCSTEATMEPEADLEQKLAPHRRVITLPDGTQQQIVEVTPEEAEAILGHPIPALDEPEPAEPEPEPAEPEPAVGVGAEPEPAVGVGAEPEPAAGVGANAEPDVGAEAKPGAGAAVAGRD